jgi:hypothetical protein
MKNSNDTIWDRTSDLLICSAVPTAVPNIYCPICVKLVYSSHIILWSICEGGQNRPQVGSSVKLRSRQAIVQVKNASVQSASTQCTLL